jgi:hypothetical protein
MKCGSSSPIPRTNSARGIQAIPEIGLRASISGVVYASSDLERPNKRPNGIPTKQAMAKPTISRLKVLTAHQTL